MSEEFVVGGDDYGKWLKKGKLYIRSERLNATVSLSGKLCCLSEILCMVLLLVKKRVNPQWDDCAG